MVSEAEAKQKVFDQELRLIERSGYYLLIIYLAMLFVCGLVLGSPYNRSWSLVLIHLVFGRPGNVAAGVYEGYHWFFIFVQCNIQDVIFLLLVYPLVVAGSRKIKQSKFLKDRFAILHVTAHRQKKYIEPFGAIGLVIFVYLPVATTGLLVGALVGHLLGMRSRVIFPAVIFGNVLIVGSMLWISDQFRDWYVEHASEIRYVDAWARYIAENKAGVGIGILAVIGSLYLLFKGLMWWRKRAKGPGQAMTTGADGAGE